MLLAIALFAHVATPLAYEVVLASDAAQTTVFGGKVVFYQANATSNVTMYGNVTGLPANSNHGIHLHSTRLTNSSCMTAGAHWNPANVSHGLPNSTNRHLGDLPMISSDSTGKATINTTVTVLNLFATGADSIENRTLVVHALPDDYGQIPGNATSLTVGNSG